MKFYFRSNLVFVLVLGAVLFLVSCKQNLEEYWSNGNIKTKVEYLKSNKDSYRYFEYYQNSQLKIEATYINALLDGEYRLYYNNGQLKYLRHYEHGKITGVEQLYSETGKLQQQRVYEKSRLINEQIYKRTLKGSLKY